MNVPDLSLRLVCFNAEIAQCLQLCQDFFIGLKKQV